MDALHAVSASELVYELVLLDRPVAIDSPRFRTCTCVKIHGQQDFGHFNAGWGPHGSSDAPTPMLNKLAAEGIVLDRFYVYKVRLTQS